MMAITRALASSALLSLGYLSPGVQGRFFLQRRVISSTSTPDTFLADNPESSAEPASTKTSDRITSLRNDSPRSSRVRFTQRKKDGIFERDTFPTNQNNDKYILGVCGAIIGGLVAGSATVTVLSITAPVWIFGAFVGGGIGFLSGMKSSS